MQAYFKIGEISKLYGIGVDSLRYYEKIGILHPERGESGYRHYSVQDIWKLNIIRDLRGLGFGMEAIRSYLEHHSVATTMALLEQEQTAIDEKIRSLEALRRNVTQRMESLQKAQSRSLDRLTLETYPDRRCYSIQEGYSEEHEMDVLIKRLTNMDQKHLYVIGSNQLGTVISLPEARKNRICYESVFVIDPLGQDLLPGGTYLTVTYRGDYSQTRFWVQQMLTYAQTHALHLQETILELLWIDIHTSANTEEHITELQARIEEGENLQ